MRHPRRHLADRLELLRDLQLAQEILPVLLRLAQLGQVLAVQDHSGQVAFHQQGAHHEQNTPFAALLVQEGDLAAALGRFFRRHVMERGAGLLVIFRRQPGQEILPFQAFGVAAGQLAQAGIDQEKAALDIDCGHHVARGGKNAVPEIVHLPQLLLHPAEFRDVAQNERRAPEAAPAKERLAVGFQPAPVAVLAAVSELKLGRLVGDQAQNIETIESREIVGMNELEQ